VADLTGFGHLAGGLAQGIQAGGRTALSWAGLKQQQQQIEMQKQQQAVENNWKIMSMGLTMLDKKYPRETRMQGIEFIKRAVTGMGGDASHLDNYNINLKSWDKSTPKFQRLVKDVSEGKTSLSQAWIQLDRMFDDFEADADDEQLAYKALESAEKERVEKDKFQQQQLKETKQDLKWWAGYQLEEQRTNEYINRGKEQAKKLKQTEKGVNIYNQQQAVIREIKAIETRNKVGGLNPLVLLGLHTKEERNNYLSNASKPVVEQLKGDDRKRYMALTKRLGELTEQIAGSLEMEEMSQLYQSPEDVRNAYNTGEISSVEEAADILKRLFPEQYE